MRTTTTSVAAVALAGLAVIALPRPAAADLRIVETSTVNGTKQTSQIQIAATRVRAEMADVQGRKMVVLFDSRAGTMRVLNLGEKTYQEVTKAQMDGIAPGLRLPDRTIAN